MNGQSPPLHSSSDEDEAGVESEGAIIETKKEPTVPLRFSDSMLDSFEDVCERTDDSIAFCREVASFMKKRAQIEEEYGKQLAALCKQYLGIGGHKRKFGLQSTGISGSLWQAWIQLLQLTSSKGEHSRQQSRALNEGVSNLTVERSNEMEAARKEYVLYGKRYRAELQEAHTAVKKQQHFLAKARREEENAQQSYDKARHNPTSKEKDVQKFLEKATKCTERVEVAAIDTQITVSKAEDMQTHFYEHSMPEVMESFQSLEEDAGKTLKLALATYKDIEATGPVYCADYVKSLEAALDTIDYDRDLQRYILENSRRNHNNTPASALISPTKSGRLSTYVGSPSVRRAFKKRFCVLMGAQNRFFIFDSEDALSPRHVLMMNGMSVAPIDPTLFKTDFAFSLATVDGLVVFFHADTKEEFDDWLRQINRVRKAKDADADAIRKEHRLTVKISDAKNLPSLDFTRRSCNPYCILKLNSQPAARTPTAWNTTEPFWGEEFQFDVLPTPFQELEVDVYHRKRLGKDDIIGQVQVSALELEDGQVLEKWYPIQVRRETLHAVTPTGEADPDGSSPPTPSSPTPAPPADPTTAAPATGSEEGQTALTAGSTDMGTIRLKIGYMVDYVLPLHHYKELHQTLITAPPLAVAAILFGFSAHPSMDLLARRLVRLLETAREVPDVSLLKAWHHIVPVSALPPPTSGSPGPGAASTAGYTSPTKRSSTSLDNPTSKGAVPFIQAAIAVEVSTTENPNVLFRQNSLTTKLTEHFMRFIGAPYLRSVLAPIVSLIYSSKLTYEVDPTRLDKSEDVNQNWVNLSALVESVTVAICSSANLCPLPMREIFHHLKKDIQIRFPENSAVQYTGVSAFIFLRFFCPAILNPKLFNLHSEHPDGRVSRVLTLVAKTVQNMANLTEYGMKEPCMTRMNSIIRQHTDALKDYIDKISDVNVDGSTDFSRIDSPDTDLARELASVTAVLLSRLPTIKEKGYHVAQDPTLRTSLHHMCQVRQRRASEQTGRELRISGLLASVGSNVGYAAKNKIEAIPENERVLPSGSSDDLEIDEEQAIIEDINQFEQILLKIGDAKALYEEKKKEMKA